MQEKRYIIKTDKSKEELQKLLPNSTIYEDRVDGVKVYDPETEISIIWGIVDVKEVAPDISDDDAMDVLMKVDDKHDANNGVTWETLKFWAYNY